MLYIIFYLEYIKIKNEKKILKNKLTWKDNIQNYR